MPIALCAYCNSARGDTRDHVPPRSFLSRPFRAGLRTVPACSKCNSLTSADEEYLRDVVLTLYSNSPSADSLWESGVARSFDRSPAIESSVWRALYVEAGTPFVALQEQRVTRVATKIVRGLTFLHSSVRLPLNATILTRVYEPSNTPRLLGQLLSGARVDALDAPHFTFRHMASPSADIRDLWELGFFESLCVAVGVST
jgi:hypothetical protein